MSLREECKEKGVEARREKEVKAFLSPHNIIKDAFFKTAEKGRGNHEK